MTETTDIAKYKLDAINECAYDILTRAKQSYQVGAMTASHAERKAAIALFQKAANYASMFSLEYEYPTDTIKAICDLLVDDKYSTNK